MKRRRSAETVGDVASEWRYASTATERFAEGERRCKQLYQAQLNAPDAERHDWLVRNPMATFNRHAGAGNADRAFESADARPVDALSGNRRKPNRRMPWRSSGRDGNGSGGNGNGGNGGTNAKWGRPGWTCDRGPDGYGSIGRQRLRQGRHPRLQHLPARTLLRLQLHLPLRRMRMGRRATPAASTNAASGDAVICDGNALVRDFWWPSTNLLSGVRVDSFRANSRNCVSFLVARTTCCPGHQKHSRFTRGF